MVLAFLLESPFVEVVEHRLELLHIGGIKYITVYILNCATLQTLPSLYCQIAA